MKPGTVVDGRFQIERVAGRGGTATVYRALDLYSNSEVALKIMHGTWAERLAREAAVLAELRHPAIVGFVSFGAVDSNQPYLAMEWLEGETLAQRLLRQPLSVADGVLLAIRCAEALIAAHERGVVHRDLKPSNLFLRDGQVAQVTLLDFGIAQVDRPAKDLTRTGAILGTPSYMAPEQARGASGVDGRADVFALGCVLFHCLIGRAPFQGETSLAVLAKIVLDPAQRLRELRPDLPPLLDDLVARMLAKEPAQRPAGAAELAAELRALGSQEDLAGGPPPVIQATDSLSNDERRLLGIVVLDGAGGETLAPDGMAALSDAARAYGGHLERLIGGAVIVAFFGRGAATDLARHTARAALALRVLAASARVGVATGRGVWSEAGPIGDVIDRAMRMLQPGGPPVSGARSSSSVLIDDLTAGLLSGDFEMGVDGGCRTLLRERDETQRRYTLLGRPSPFVGRDRELAALVELFRESVEDSSTRAALVIGPAGSGKSRLRHELLRDPRILRSAPRAWIARGDPLRRESAFGLIARCVGAAARLHDGEPLLVRQEKLRAMLEGRLAAAHLGRVSGFLGEITGTPFPDQGLPSLQAARQDGRLMRDFVRDAVRDWLAMECAAQPIVLAFDDLHWGDLPSIRILDDLLGSLHDQPLFVLAFGRPEVRTLFPQLWVERPVQEMRLGGLSPKASASLAREVAGDQLDGAALQRIVERAGGNAFFLEELIRAAVEGDTHEAPETVVAMAQARLERLGPAARWLLRAASVFGEVFWRGGVAALVSSGQVESGDVGRWLADLVDKEVLVRRDSGRFPAEEELGFRHALMRDAAYVMLTDDDRRLGHRLAGEWLEAAGERDPMVLANHFERGGEPARALRWYLLAADRAIEGADLAAVTRSVERGIACGAEREELATLKNIAADAAELAGDLPASERLSVEALRLSARGATAWWNAAARLLAFGVFGHLNHFFEMIEAVRTAPAGAPRYEHFKAWLVAVSMASLFGRSDEARDFSQRMEEELARLEDPGPIIIAEVQHARCFIAFFGGRDPDGAYVAARRSVTALAGINDHRSLPWKQFQLVYCALVIGGYEEAEHVLLALKPAYDGVRLLRTVHDIYLSRVLSCMGRAEQALALLEQLDGAVQASHDSYLTGMRLQFSAIALAKAGRFAEAEHRVLAAIEVLAPFPPLHNHALATLARVRLHLGRAVEALDAARQACAAVEAGVAIADGESEARLILAEALRESGDRAGAHAAIVEARVRLLDRADKFTDPGRRTRFLERVDENARTLALAREWTSEQ